VTGETKGRLIGLGFGISMLPIMYVFSQHGQQVRGFVVFCVVSVFATIIYVLRKGILRARLLLPLILLFAIELSTALLLPLPSKIAGFTMIPISIGNAVLLLYILSLFDRTLGRHDADPDEGPRYGA
jgi:hypothetical protein